MSGDCFECFGDGLLELFWGSCFCGSEVLFELGPGLFNGVEIGRVGRQVEQRGPRIEQLLDPLHVHPAAPPMANLRLAKVLASHQDGATAEAREAIGRAEARMQDMDPATRAQWQTTVDKLQSGPK